MYTIEEFKEVIAREVFTADFSAIRQSLVNHRLSQPILLFKGSEDQLAHFVEAVLASAPDWDPAERVDICRMAAEISETLSARFIDQAIRRKMRIRSALLYEFAALPSLSSSILKNCDLSDFLLSFFRRTGLFAKLTAVNSPKLSMNISEILVGELALIDDANQYGVASQQNDSGEIEELVRHSVSSVAWKIGECYDLGLTASELRAFSVLLGERVNRATIENIGTYLIPTLRQMGFPSELLPAQQAAIDGGLLNSAIPSWGFAAPTGSGKTYLARLLIADLLFQEQDAKVIYLVPSKALVSEVASSLGEAFDPLKLKVLALSAQLVDLDVREKTDLDDASIVVMTPEKADMLLRLGAEFLEAVTLAIVDEAHHIESGTRGALLELYLWRLKRILPVNCRYVFLSAVAPNIGQIANWVDSKSSSVTYVHRPTRMRVGIYHILGKGVSARGIIKYTDGTSMEVVSLRAETAQRKGLCQLASFLIPAGPVLIVAKGKKECENIADELKEWLAQTNSIESLTEEQLASDSYKGLDASLEREMYSDVSLRALIKNKIAYHHAGLPPSVRHGVERAIRERQVDYVIATTTLAEGVNFPFSSVVVQSLALKEAPEAGKPSRYSPVTPRTFWNIAGRAGRPGFDSEGQVILFEPSLGLDKISAVIDPYVQPELTSLAPVKSALAEALEEIREEVKNGRYAPSQLREVKLPETLSRRARGAINLLRVGLMHAQATGLVDSPESLIESSFAAQFLSSDAEEFAKSVMHAQAEALNSYLAGGDVPSMVNLAELGLSLETLSELREYVHQMQNWQLESFGKLFFGSNLNLDQAQYIIGPVAKRMSELEGPSLGGFLSDVIVKWLSGITFTSIRKQSDFSNRLEDLIAVIYSRVQFLLPWGLWATDWLIEQETKSRNINYDNQVKKLAYLADAGVPNFDALQLTHLHIERVDATRLSQAYMRVGGSNTGVDCIGWVINQKPEYLERILRGQDNRRIEHRFFERIEALKQRSE